MAATIGRIMTTNRFKLVHSLVVLIGSIGGLMLMGVTIDLGFIKNVVETSAQSILGRDISIKGPVTLEFSTWPSIEVQRVQIANVPSSVDPLFFSAEKADIDFKNRTFKVIMAPKAKNLSF